jgi:hypothetical protein
MHDSAFILEKNFDDLIKALQTVKQDWKAVESFFQILYKSDGTTYSSIDQYNPFQAIDPAYWTGDAADACSDAFEKEFSYGVSLYEDIRTFTQNVSDLLDALEAARPESGTGGHPTSKDIGVLDQEWITTQWTSSANGDTAASCWNSMPMQALVTDYLDYQQDATYFLSNIDTVAKSITGSPTSKDRSGSYFTAAEWTDEPTGYQPPPGPPGPPDPPPGPPPGPEDPGGTWPGGTPSKPGAASKAEAASQMNDASDAVVDPAELADDAAAMADDAAGMADDSLGDGVLPASFGGGGGPDMPLQPATTSDAASGRAGAAAAAGRGTPDLAGAMGGAKGGGMGGGGMPMGGGGGAGNQGGGKAKAKNEESKALYEEDREWTHGVIGVAPRPTNNKQ